MQSEKNKSFRTSAHFWNDERGSATVETLLNFPLLLFILFLIADVSFSFFNYTIATREVHDANRSLSVGRLETEEEIEARITERISGSLPNAVVDAVIQSGLVRSTVTFPVTDVIAFGRVTGFEGITMSIQSAQYIEF